MSAGSMGKRTAPPPREISDRGDISRLIAICQQICPWRVPLLEAALHQVITLAEVAREGVVPFATLDRADKPAIVLIGDDDGLDTGPDGWACRSRLAGWARAAVIHGTGGQVADYRAAVLAAVQTRRLVLVETGTQHHGAWSRLFTKPGIPTMSLVPPAGGLHPVRDRESMH